MSEGTEPTTPATEGDAAPAGKKRAGGLNGMLIADLRAMANGLGINGAAKMKKVDLVAAIKAGQGGGGSQPSGQQDKREQPAQKPAEETAQDRSAEAGDQGEDRGRTRSRNRNRDQQNKQDSQNSQDQANKQESQSGQEQQGKQSQQPQQSSRQAQRNKQDQQQGQKAQNQQDQQQKQGTSDQGKSDQNRSDQGRPDQGRSDQDQADDQGSGRNRRRRGRDRDRSARGGRNEPDTTVLDDDVLVPAAGILDVLDNYAFVRTSGYLAGPDDVYLSLSMVRKFGLRRGDAVLGQVRQPREGERKEKFNPMVQIDSVNGADPEIAEDRPDFTKLTPVHPTERLRLETTPGNTVGRIIDLAAPIGKGQRGLVVAPRQSGRTRLLRSIAQSVTTNNPECHLMVLLVDERPEEVTDFQRSIKGEVIASTFDRPATDHTAVADLAIERAKRLVELGHDVVVLLDGLTRLGRAWNHAAPVNGRVLSGGVDSSALHPPKRLFGAARKIENGGSLTILATAVVESGSEMDEVIFDEFQGTGNLEIRLRRDLADKRHFPAIDAVRSGTRRDDLLLGEQELAIVTSLRRRLGGMEPEQALEFLLERISSTQTNIELLTKLGQGEP